MPHGRGISKDRLGLQGYHGVVVLARCAWLEFVGFARAAGVPAMAIVWLGAWLIRSQQPGFQVGVEFDHSSRWLAVVVGVSVAPAWCLLRGLQYPGRGDSDVTVVASVAAMVLVQALVIATAQVAIYTLGRIYGREPALGQLAIGAITMTGGLSVFAALAPCISALRIRASTHVAVWSVMLVAGAGVLRFDWPIPLSGALRVAIEHPSWRSFVCAGLAAAAGLLVSVAISRVRSVRTKCG